MSDFNKNANATLTFGCERQYEEQENGFKIIGYKLLDVDSPIKVEISMSPQQISELLALLVDYKTKQTSIKLIG